MISKIDAFDMPMSKVFSVTLRNIVWDPKRVVKDLGDECSPKYCHVVFEADRNSTVSEIINTAKVNAARKCGAGVLSADVTIDKEEMPDLDDTLEFEEVY